MVGYRTSGTQVPDPLILVPRAKSDGSDGPEERGFQFAMSVYYLMSSQRVDQCAYYCDL